MFFQRRKLPPVLEASHRAFHKLLPELERAKSALLASVPGTRLPGRPLAETLLEFEEGLRQVRAGMETWRIPDVQDAWTRASEGLDEAIERAEGARLSATAPEGFEGLIGLVGDLMAPLDAFGDAAERFRDLRRRTPPSATPQRP
ncbi:MAG: hypothetical protein WD965_09355 [Actinomycetota bacterium]